MSSSMRCRSTVMDKLLVKLESLHVQQLHLCKGGELDQKDEKTGQHQLLGGSNVPTTAKRFSTILFMRSFNEGDITAFADYLSRLHGPGGLHRRMLSNGIVVN